MGIQTNTIQDNYDYYTEYIAADECAECGGQCCKIGYEPDYVKREKYTEMGILPTNAMFAELKDIVKSSFNTGELYEVVKTRKDRARNKIASLKLNINQCRYLGDTGCVIPREERTATCRGYVCSRVRNKWIDQSQKMKLGVTV
jgi:Fe-S-cluster containining protein